MTTPKELIEVMLSGTASDIINQTGYTAFSAPELLGEYQNAYHHGMAILAQAIVDSRSPQPTDTMGENETKTSPPCCNVCDTHDVTWWPNHKKWQCNGCGVWLGDPVETMTMGENEDTAKAGSMDPGKFTVSYNGEEIGTTNDPPVFASEPQEPEPIGVNLNAAQYAYSGIMSNLAAVITRLDELTKRFDAADEDRRQLWLHTKPPTCATCKHATNGQPGPNAQCGKCNPIYSKWESWRKDAPGGPIQ